MGNTLEGQAAAVDVVILGSGPTGLGAAYRLKQYGFENWLLLDGEKHPGGIAGSIKTTEGFRFDHGYKTISSHYVYLDRVLESLYSDESEKKLVSGTRDHYVYIRGKLVRYPLQNNLAGLPSSEKQACALDLLKTKMQAKDSGSVETANNLDEYLVSEWGESLCNLFFRPYIFKAWAYPTGKLRWDWVKHKIAPSNVGDDINRMLEGEQRDLGWGVDAKYMYPKKGGMIGVWRSLAKTLPKNNVRFKTEVAQLDIEAKKIVTKAGLEITFKQLISTMPLTSLLELSGKSDLTENLVHSSLYVVCLGLRGVAKHKDITGCIFYPESDVIFHRVSIFSSHDPDSIPADDVKLSTIKLANGEQAKDGSAEKPGPYWSMLLEVSGGPLKTVSEATIVDDVIRDACSVNLLDGTDEIVSMHLTEMTHGYPLPTISSSEQVEESLKWLKTKDVWSRGRFGSFRYEVGDVDHCFIQGVEAVDNMLKGIPERCISGCDIEGKSELPAFDVRQLDEVAHLAFENSEEGSVVSDDTLEPLVTSDSEQSINAGSVRNAISVQASDADST